MRLLVLVLLIAALGSAQDAAQQQQQATVVSGDAAAATVDSLTDAADTPTDTTNGTATDAGGTKPRFPTRDEILGQMPPVLPVRSGIPPVDAFYLMFPALSSLLRWGSLFPAQSILGAMPDNLQQSASKVVLVLADDANAQKSRVTRQNAPIVPPNPLNAPVMLQQLLSQMPQPNLGQSWLPDGLVGQMPPLPNIQDFNLGQPLAGLQLPSLDGLLGAPPPAPAAVTPPPPPPAAAKAATDDVAQAPPAVAQAPPPPFAGFFDGTNNMLGSALAAMPQAPTPDAFMAGLRQFWPGAAPAAAADATAQASDISEVRVKPETPESSSIINYRDPEQREAQLAQLKMKSALQMEQDKQRVPLLWFRMPPTSSNTKTTHSPTEQREIESKLQMFERQVIAELKLLQQIEALAREMRANAQEGGRQQQQPAYKLRYPLSRTPVHKITRSDIERALRDDYVRRLLNKEAQRKVQGSAAFKRQATTSTTTPQQTLSKEDIVNVMAYAYRLANEKQRAAATAEPTPHMQQQQRQWEAAEQQAAKEKTQQQQQQQEMMMRQMMSQPMEQQQQQQQLLMQRQWMEEQAKRQQQQAQQEAMARQMETMQRQAAIDQQQQLAERQWADAKMRAMQQQRQWTEETMKLKQQQQQQAQQQRQWTEEAMKQQTIQQQPMQQQQQPVMEQQQQLRQWEQPAERQWADEKMKAMRQQAEQQRQWSEESIRQQQQQQQQAEQQQQMRQWTEDATKLKQQQQQQAEQMRQWSEDATKLKQQQQAEQMRQWSEDATKLKQQQQQQAEQQQLRQWEQAEDQQQQQQPRQWTEDATKVKQQEQQQQAEQQTMRMETDGDGLMVGEATPQMTDTDGKERHKVDVLGLGGNHHKKAKSKVAPTIINYYQQAPPPRPVAYHYAPPAPSSYGTSYGGGGYGSNAYGGYRAAVGNDAIDSMLREHQVLAAAIKPPTDDNSNRNTTTATLTTDDDNNNHRIQKRLAQFPATALDRTSGGCGCGSAHCACGSSCRCGQRNHMQQEQQQQVKAPSMHRVRRSAEPHTEAEPATNAGYGTLETIDEGSLNVLRKEYKLGLKEITLSPDEDPAEALMRYNAASIREALERASQEPLEISGDQLAVGVEAGAEEDYGSGATAETPTETETETPKYESETGAKTQELPTQQDAPSGGSNETVASELAAARAEFQKLYQLIQSLKEQLNQAEQGLRDCQHAERCTTISTTSTPSTTTSTSSSTTTTTTPRSNAIDGATTVLPYSEKSWERLLASKGYDTKYLSKTHQQQYTQGENLALPKAETSNASGDYSYQELQPYDPDNKSKRASGNGTSTSTTTTTTERSNVAQLLNSLMDEQEEEEEKEKEQQLEQQSADGDSNAIATTPTPYALRGKFVRRRSASSRLDSHSQSQVRSVVRTTRQAKVTRREHTELAVLRARSTKLDQLIDVLHELLRLQLQRERSAISQVKSNPNSISSTKKLRTRRLRRKPNQSSASTSTSSHTSATTTTTSTSSTGEESDALLGAPKGFSDNLLRPYMGLLPIAQPHDPWTEKAFNPQHALYNGGGSYEPYLRPRRDTHIMPTPVQSHQLLTPGMLERLLRIKAEFQRRFPHLYQGMLNHQTNQTRVVVKPPLLVRNEPKLKSDSTPVYELGAAERGLFDEPSSDVEATSERIVEKKKKQHRDDDNDDDDDVDFFRFEDEDLEDNNDHDHHNNDNDKDVEPFDD